MFSKRVIELFLRPRNVVRECCFLSPIPSWHFQLRVFSFYRFAPKAFVLWISITLLFFFMRDVSYRSFWVFRDERDWGEFFWLNRGLKYFNCWKKIELKPQRSTSNKNRSRCSEFEDRENSSDRLGSLSSQFYCLSLSRSLIGVNDYFSSSSTSLADSMFIHKRESDLSSLFSFLPAQ